MREETLYTLKLWRDGNKAEDWRASLKEIGSNETKNFSSVQELTTHLIQLGTSKTQETETRMLKNDQTR